MNIKSTNLPLNYSSIVSVLLEGYVLSKADEDKCMLHVAFVDQDFNMQKEIKFDNYVKHKSKLVINPHDASIIGCLQVDGCLSFVDLNSNVIKRFDFNCAAGFDNKNRLHVANRIDSNNLEVFVYGKGFSLIAAKKVEDVIYKSSGSVN